MTQSLGITNPPLLLDSSLIIQTNKYLTKIKLIKCGDFYQVYYYKDYKQVTDKELEKVEDSPLDIDNLFKKENYNKKNDKKVIEYKNIMRSNFQLQRLVKANKDKFKTFITLTFKDNVVDIAYANKKFNTWRTKISSIKKDFVYVCVPEFQKRGAVHYHLLTNLDIEKDINLILQQENKKNCYDVKYWRYGFSSVFPLIDINVVGYISKYMTKDIDNRLYGRNRYLSSHKGLEYPRELHIDLENKKQYQYFIDVVSSCSLVYEKEYLDYFGSTIQFKEYSLEWLEYDLDENCNIVPKLNNLSS